jgi:hypothetical protein
MLFPSYSVLEKLNYLTMIKIFEKTHNSPHFLKQKTKKKAPTSAWWFSGPVRAQIRVDNVDEERKPKLERSLSLDHLAIQ